MLLQPETRPITQEQLVNEVKGLYAGLVMVEKKCVEIDQQQSQTTNKLSNEQWQALITLHRTLLHEHHDFFLASQHPSSSPALRRLATKYAMPARMWRHGIHSFLELLRHRLPDSLDHMLAFVYLAYSMMPLLMESVPSFEETWIECLGDLARYRMAMEEADLRDREVWSGVARMWYNKAPDKSPNVGRIQHHLAVLARPNIVQQLFYYSKALVSVIPFSNTRESNMLLFNPFLEGSVVASQKYPLVKSALVTANSVMFMHGPILDYTSLMDQLYSLLDDHIGRVCAEFRVQGPEIASSLCAATFDFRDTKAFLSQIFRDHDERERAYVETHLEAHDKPDGPVLGAHNTTLTHWMEISPQELASTYQNHQNRKQWCKCFKKPSHDDRKGLLEAAVKGPQNIEIPGGPMESTYVFHNVRASPCRRGRSWAVLHAEHLILKYVGASFGTFADWTGSIFSTFLRNASLAAKVLLVSALPITHAAPTGNDSRTGNIHNHKAWLDFETMCHITGWASTSAFGALVLYVGLRGPRRDLARYCVLSFGAAGASLVLLDARAPPEVRWPTICVGYTFLVHFWMRVSELYDMGHGWLGPILGLAILIDVGLLHLTIGGQGGDQGLFLQLLLACLCLGLSICASMARFHQHINVNRRFDELV
jgi:hypothetical protein